MDRPHTPVLTMSLGLLLAQSRILQAVANGDILHATPAELIRSLDIAPEVFRAALHDLVEGGWVFTKIGLDGRLIVGRERRAHELGPPGLAERRQPHSIWEGLHAPVAW